jgi:hypothetical protein
MAHADTSKKWFVAKPRPAEPNLTTLPLNLEDYGKKAKKVR